MIAPLLSKDLLTLYSSGASASRTAVGFWLFAVLLTACSQAPSVAEGRVLYQENGCASCHGISGRGDGLAAAALISKPTDLHNPALFKRGAGESAIARTLAEGVLGAEAGIPVLAASHHELVMPKFDHLTERERRSIARYVISMQTDLDPGRARP